jgi:LysM domain
MAGRSAARWLAPLALVGCVVALYVVVTSTLSEEGGDAGSNRAGQSVTQGGRPASDGTGRRERRPRRMYTVKPGDTASTISEKTGVSVRRIARLNPRVDLGVLSPGDRLKLRP